MKGGTPYLRRKAVSASDMIFSFVRINTGFVSFGGYVVQRLSTSYPLSADLKLRLLDYRGQMID
jgi:hypothetical protein